MGKIKRKLGPRTKKGQFSKSLKARTHMAGTGKGKNSFLFAKTKLKAEPKKNKGQGFQPSVKGKARARKVTKPVAKSQIKDFTIDSFEEMMQARMKTTAKQRQRQAERDLVKFLGPQPTDNLLKPSPTHTRPGMTVRTILRSE